MSRHDSRFRAVRILPAIAATLVVALSACGAEEESAQPEPTASESPSPSGDETLALTADGSMTAKCAMPSPEVLATFDTAFEGTVTSIDGGTVTLEVDRWYAGEEASTATVEAPSQALEDLLMAVDFQEGRTYLVSADAGRVSLCGFTAETSPELEALYEEAYAG